jgi:hypothetical protein
MHPTTYLAHLYSLSVHPCIHLYIHSTCNWSGTRWRSLLRHYATSRKVAGSIPYKTIGFFNSRYSDWLRAGRPGGGSSSPGRVKNFHFSISTRPVLGSTQPPIKWVPGTLSRG